MYVARGREKEIKREEKESYDDFFFFRKHFYVGSANFDWRSLTQVKEMGVLVKNCPKLAEDMGKIFDVYWMLGGEGTSIPDE